jgi:hypothetical protein
MTPVAVKPCRRALRGSALLLAGLLAAWPGGVRAAELPADLDLVPRDAVAFFHFRAADIWNAEWMADARHFLNRAGPEALKTFTQKFAPDPSSIDRITLVMLTPQSFGQPFPHVDPEAVSCLVIVRTKKPYDRLAVMQQLGMREKTYRRHLYHFNEDLWSGLILIDPHTFLIGSEDALVMFLDRQRTGHRDGPLQAALQEAAKKHQLVFGVNARVLGKEEGAKFMPPPMQKLLEARCLSTALDLDKEPHLNLRLDYDKADEAGDGAKALRGTLDLARMGLAQGIAEMENVLKKPAEKAPISELPENFGALMGLGMLRELDTLLEKAPIKQDGTAVTLDLTYKGLQSTNTAIIAMMGITAIGVRASATFDRIEKAIASRDAKNPNEEYLKKLAGAMDKYHQDKGTYPAPAMYDKDGRPLLSWRVALLPYLGDQEAALYKEFHLDEPWDSLHNKKLLKKLPQSFRSPNSYRSHKTTTLVFTGEAAVFSGTKGPRKSDVGPGAILLAYADGHDAVWWTKPADFTYADGQPLPSLFNKYGYGQVHVLLGNGTYKVITRETDEKLIREMIRRTGTKVEKIEKKIEEKKE